MARGPSDSGLARVVIEEATVVDVNKRNYTVSVVTRHTSKRFDDLQIASPYFHNDNGEGIYVLPEVGAVCEICKGSDTTPPFILCFLAIPNATESEDGTPARSTSAGGSTSDVSFRGKRLDIQPGDIVMTTRDENFVILRRGGILQIGSTDIAQRMYIPINNFIRDICENYAMDTLGGNVRWSVERQENDPGGDAPVSYIFNIGEYAQDEKASVSVRHFPPSGPTDNKLAWEVVVARDGIDRDTGEFTSEKYTMSVAQDGTKMEMVGADYTLEVTGSHTVNVSGDIAYKASGTAKLEGGSEARIKASQVITEGTTLLGGASAVQGVPMGVDLLAYLATLAAAINGIAPGSATPPTPALLSTKVKVSS